MSGRGRGRGRGGPPSQSVQLLRRSADECGLDSRNLRSLGNAINGSSSLESQLYPDIMLHSSGRLMRASDLSSSSDKNNDDNDAAAAPGKKGKKIVTPVRTAGAVQLISKGRDIQYRISHSVFYLQPEMSVPDVIRYKDMKRRQQFDDASNNKKQQPMGITVLQSVLKECCYATSSGSFLPEELTVLYNARGKRPKRKKVEKKKVNKVLSLEELEKRAKRMNNVLDSSDDEDEEKEGEGVEVAEEAEEEDEESVEDYAKNYYESEEEDSGGENEATF